MWICFWKTWNFHIAYYWLGRRKKAFSWEVCGFPLIQKVIEIQFSKIRYTIKNFWHTEIGIITVPNSLQTNHDWNIFWQINVNNLNQDMFSLTALSSSRSNYFAMRRHETRSEDRKVWRLSWNEFAEPIVLLKEARAAMDIADMIPLTLQWNKIVSICSSVKTFTFTQIKPPRF